MLTDIMHQCKTVEDVRNYIELYDHSIFIQQVFLYIDTSGEYLIVEPYKLTKGNDPTYVLANFCPSITSNQDARKTKRYRDGEDYLNSNTAISSFDFCRTLSDTMSVSRSRNGDGTLLTSIWDTQNGLVNLYFYHDYDSTVQFDIAEELKLGNHTISIPELFPANTQFQRLEEYKTPVTVPSLIFYLAFIGCFIFGLSIMFFLASLGKGKRQILIQSNCFL